MALTLRPPKPITDEDLVEFSRRNPGVQFERSGTGELIVTPTGSASGRRELALGVQLARWAGEAGTGVTFGPSTGFRMPDGAVLSPDASWVKQERWDGLTREEQEGFAPLCPDAVFEIASPSDGTSSLGQKMRAYLVYGARIGVLIDPHAGTVEIHRPGQVPQLLHTPKTVSLDPVLGGFVLDTKPLFEAWAAPGGPAVGPAGG